MTITFGDTETGTLIDVELESGRSLWCWKCVVAYTYDGFEVRTPSEKCNEWMLDNITRDAQSMFGNQWPIHVFHPDRPVGEIDYPPVRVVGFFTSLPMADSQHLSSAILAWFQDSQTPLVAESVHPQFLTVAWESIAMDYET